MQSATLKLGNSGLIRPRDCLSMQSLIVLLPGKLQPFVSASSLIIGCLKATQLFGHSSSLQIVHVEVFSLLLSNTALTPPVAFLPFDFTKSLSDCQSASFRIFYNHISSSTIPYHPSRFEQCLHSY